MATRDILLKTSLPGCRLTQCSSYTPRDLARSTVGLELGTNAVKAVAMRKIGDRFRVVWWGIGELDPGHPEERRRDVVVSVLRRWRSLKGFPTRITLLAPAGHRYVTVVLPRMPLKELRQAALWEARSQLYFDDNMLMSACPMAGTHKQEKVTVVVVGIPDGERQKIYETLRRAGLRVAKKALPEAVALGSLARCFPDSQISRFLDLGFGAAKLVALVGGKPVFYRELPKVGESMVRAISEQMDLNPKLAERILRRSQFVRDPDEDDPDLAYWGEVGSVQQIVFPEVSGLANEIEMSVHYLRAHFPAEAEDFYCVGGLTEIPGLLNYLSERIGIDFRSLPFPEEKIDFVRPEVAVAFKRNWSRLASATGVALWNVRGEHVKGAGIPLKPKRRSPLGKVNLKLVASLALTLVVAFANLALMPKVRYLQSEVTAQRAYLDELMERIETARVSTDAGDDPAARLGVLRDKMRGWDTLLAALAYASNDRVWLRELGGTSQVLSLSDVISENSEGIVGSTDEEEQLPDIASLQLSGLAASQDDAEQFATNLEKLGLFSSVHLGSLERDETDPNVVRFTLSLGVAPAKSEETEP